MKIEIENILNLCDAARLLLENLPEQRIFAFYGSMGAGKTTFIKALCEELETTDTVTSPTFTLVNEYSTKEKGPLYHFDFYRINKITEVLDFGIDEYFDSGNYCFMEWPEMIEELLPPETVSVHITVTDKESRILEFSR